MPAVKEEPTAKIKESFDDLHEIDASDEWEEVACKVIAIDCSNVHVFANALLVFLPLSRLPTLLPP